MAKTSKKSEDERSHEETQRLAEKTLKTLLSTPPKPRIGKSGKGKGK